MTITTGRFGVDQDSKQVTEYVPPKVVVVGTATLPAPAPQKEEVKPQEGTP